MSPELTNLYTRMVSMPYGAIEQHLSKYEAECDALYQQYITTLIPPDTPYRSESQSYPRQTPYPAVMIFYRAVDLAELRDNMKLMNAMYVGSIYSIVSINITPNSYGVRTRADTISRDVIPNFMSDLPHISEGATELRNIYRLRSSCQSGNGHIIIPDADITLIDSYLTLWADRTIDANKCVHIIPGITINTGSYGHVMSIPVGNAYLEHDNTAYPNVITNEICDARQCTVFIMIVKQNYYGDYSLIRNIKLRLNGSRYIFIRDSCNIRIAARYMKAYLRMMKQVHGGEHYRTAV